MHRKLFPDQPYNPNLLRNKNVVIEYLKKLEPTKRKNKVTPLVVVYPDIQEYQDILQDSFRQIEFNKPDKPQNLLNKGNVKNIYDDLEETADFLYKKNELSTKEIQDIQNYIILSLYTMINPRRALDFTEMKINQINKNNDNYIDGDEFVFNKFKNSDLKGEQRIKIPARLMKILKKWININSNDYLLFDSYNNKLTSIKLNQRLNKLLGEKVGINALRHTYLTDKYKKTIDKYKKLNDDMESMGSNIAQSKYYIK